mmetsp:Transcript_1216/g.4519  ORF Transcript_1216/g.4519 Transcript_1216/m.4519 type:complete len:234 (+) Transcript_1216:439-1140(+)
MLPEPALLQAHEPRNERNVRDGEDVAEEERCRIDALPGRVHPGREEAHPLEQSRASHGAVRLQRLHQELVKVWHCFRREALQSYPHARTVFWTQRHQRRRLREPLVEVLTAHEALTDAGLLALNDECGDEATRGRLDKAWILGRLDVERLRIFCLLAVLVAHIDIHLTPVVLNPLLLERNPCALRERTEIRGKEARSLSGRRLAQTALKEPRFYRRVSPTAFEVRRHPLGSRL